MLFSLEAVKAKEGDSLILHFGTTDAPKLVVIDGGPGGVFKQFLEPRLLAIKQKLSPNKALPLEAVGVSHIDGDHIAGVLDLFQQLVKAKDANAAAAYDIRDLWHNGLKAIVGTDDEDGVASMAERVSSASSEAEAVLSSVPQGNKLDTAARTLGISPNKRFGGGAIVDGDKTKLGDLSLFAVAPSKGRVAKLRADWQKKTPDEEEAAALAAYLDETVYNLSSVVLVAEQGGKRMLLTGDARGDHIIEGLEKHGLLEKKKTVDFDLVKLPHHGSDRNVATDFFRRVRGRHYVISGDGKHGNPEIATLCMLSDARGEDEYDVWMTYREGKDGLGEKLRGWERMIEGRNATVHYPEDRDSLVVDLGDALKY
jgi:Metallo-beta-lactamase superfamily